MSEYTSTREGFQRAMEWSLTGPPEEAKDYVEGTSSPDIQYIMNGQSFDSGEYIKSLVEWRAKVSNNRPIVDEFLRDGDHLAAHMTGTINLDEAETAFESFLFGKVNNATGKLDKLVVRSIWGSVGAAPDHGTT